MGFILLLFKNGKKKKLKRRLPLFLTYEPLVYVRGLTWADWDVGPTLKRLGPAVDCFLLTYGWAIYVLKFWLIMESFVAESKLI